MKLESQKQKPIVYSLSKKGRRFRMGKIRVDEAKFGVPTTVEKWFQRD